MRHPDEEALSLLALGDVPAADSSDGGAAEHVATCPACAAHVASLREVLALGRALEDRDRPVPPPPHVWERVARELDLAPLAAPVVPPPPPPPRARSRRAVALLGVAAAALVGAVLALTPAGTRTVPVPAYAGAAVPAARADVGERVIRLTADLPPQEAGQYYEAWLLGPDDRLLALGALRASGTTELLVPEGVDLADYALLDVSREPDDGDPAHSGDSLLRGPLPG